MYNLYNRNSENKHSVPWKHSWYDDNYDFQTETLNDILFALRDKEQAKQIRYYITHLCLKKNGSKDERTNEFCRNLMHTYLYASFLISMNDKYEPMIDRWTDKFNRALINRFGRLYD